jgi:hypothetical protein
MRITTIPIPKTTRVRAGIVSSFIPASA